MSSLDQYLLECIDEEKKKRKEMELSGVRTREPNLLGVSAALDEYYFFNKLRIYCAALSYILIVNKKDEPIRKDGAIALGAEIVDLLEQHPPKSTVLQNYLKIVQLLRGLKTTEAIPIPALNEVLALQEENQAFLSLAENLELYSLLSNICIYLLNTRQANLKVQVIEINLRIIQLLVLYKEPVPHSLFRNLIITALHAPDGPFFRRVKPLPSSAQAPGRIIKNRYDWIGVFMEYYKVFLNDKARKYQYPYCKALWHYQQQQYDSAYGLLKNFQPRGMFIGLDAKMLYLKTMYEIFEKQEFRPSKQAFITEKEMLKGIEAYRSQLKYERSARKTLTYQLDFYGQFDGFFRKLYHFHNRYVGVYKFGNERFSEEKASLLADAGTITHSFRDWFVQKISAIK
jgi:hypothetical protein